MRTSDEHSRIIINYLLGVIDGMAAMAEKEVRLGRIEANVDTALQAQVLRDMREAPANKTSANKED